MGKTTMNIEGSYTFTDAPREVVWETLMDPDALATALPGGEKLHRLSDNEYEAALNVRVGPVQGNFDGQIEITDVEPPRTYHMSVNGQGGPGFVNGGGNVKLEQIEDDTLMTYAGEVQVGGRIAGVGQRLIESTARSIIRQGLETLDNQVQARVAAQQTIAARTGTAPASAPSVSSEPAITESAATGDFMSDQPEQPTPGRATSGQATSGQTIVYDLESGQMTSSTSDPAPKASELQGDVTVIDRDEASNSLAFEMESPEKPLVAGPSANEVAARVARDVAGDVRNDFVRRALSPQYVLITMVVGAVLLVILLALLAQLLAIPFTQEFVQALITFA